MENYDFEKIPLWSNDKPIFDVLLDDASGRIPAVRLEHWQNFSELLESEFFNRPKTQLVFGGHRRYDWGLMPTLGRLTETGIVDETLANNQLEHFKRAVRGRLTDNALVDEEDELWSIGQHHGLMTPLLDWTYSPYVALFFAFAKEDSENEDDNPYRAIYVLNKSFVADDELCPDIRILEPRKDDHDRLVNQAGLFTFSPNDATIENKLTDTLAAEDFEDDELRNASEDEQPGIIARYICKIYIKNEDREGCMRQLRRMNVHHASLFPDLIGASQYSNLMVAEERREYDITQSEKRAEANLTGTVTIQEDSDVMVAVGNISVAVKPESEMVFVPATDEIVAIYKILNQHGGKQVEPGRIQLIAEHLSKEFVKYKVVDWTIREPAKAKIRSMMRIALRKYGYPSSVRDEVIDAIINMLAVTEKEAV
ncbi:MAG: FRG domain-containing protein [Woeseiaceae bacterium]